MIYKILIFIFLSTVLTNVNARVGFGPGEQDWGYVKVRKDASMFWWLYYTTADVVSVYEKPLVIWLQGGPGKSSTGYGNFELIGPLDIHLKPRKYNWVRQYNVLFIDSPVGSGFSSIKGNAFATTNKQVAADLVTCMKAIFQKNANLTKVRSYIVGESYGGKTAIEFARVWYEAEKSGEIESRLMGVAMGDAWISPIDSVMSWAPYLLQTGMIDEFGYEMIEKAANETKQAIEEGRWKDATALWLKAEYTILEVTRNIDFYNIMSKLTYYKHVEYLGAEKSTDDDFLELLMNSKVKSYLNLSTTWGEQADLVFFTHSEEFMKPVIDQVEYVLNNTDLNVIVYNGQLDLIVDTPGTMHWINRMRWNDSEEWHLSDREPFVIDDIIEGYIKKYKNFAMYWINRAGHMVPKDNPIAGLQLMRDFTACGSKEC